MRFYFDTDDGERRIVDDTGTELADEAEAMEQVVSLLRDLSHVPFVAGAPRSFSARVRHADGVDLYAATLRLKVDRLT